MKMKFPPPVADAADVASTMVSQYVGNFFGNNFASLADLGGAWGSYQHGWSNEQGFNSTFSYQDILNGYSYFNSNSAYSAEDFNVRGYNSGNTSVKQTNYSSVSSSSNYTATTFYNVGNRNGYLNGYNQNNGALYFVDSNISSFSRNSDYVNFNMANGTSFQAHSSSSENDLFQYTTDGRNISYAKIGLTNRNNFFEYEDDVHYLGASEHLDTLKLSTYDSQNVWLDSSQGIIYDSVENIDATSSIGDNQLVGNAGDNEIRAGSGNDQLWGQAGNDNLYGGAGDNTFWYGKGDGNDVIYNSVASDKINLYNVSITDIVSADGEGTDFVLNMAGGESLRIVGQNGASNFILSDQSMYNYNRETHSWTKTN